MASLGELFAEQSIPWMPLKGMDTSSRFFDDPLDRPTSDLDILVKLDDYKRCRELLEKEGWKSLNPGSSLRDEFILEEAYNWQARDSWGVLLELHFRLWGIVPDGLVDDIWESAVAAPELGKTAFRMAPSLAFILSAVHFWLSPHKLLLYLWELHRIILSTNAQTVEEIITSTRKHELHLPVVLTAACSGELFDNKYLQSIATRLQIDMKLPEKMVCKRAEKHGIHRISLHRLYLARLLSRRPNRMGWKSMYRRIWPHPAIVEKSFPNTKNRFVRRFLFQMNAVTRAFCMRK